MTALRDNYSKEVRHHLRRLAGESFDRELGQDLAKLCEPLGRWEKHEISSTELDEFVHGVHQGSRRVFNLYESLKADQIVARSLASGLLTEDEVPEVVREAVSGWVKFFRDVRRQATRQGSP